MRRITVICLFGAIMCLLFAFYFGLRFPEQVRLLPTGVVTPFWLSLSKACFFLWIGYCFRHEAGSPILR